MNENVKNNEENQLTKQWMFLPYLWKLFIN